MKLPKLSKIFLFFGLIYIKSFDVGLHLLGLNRDGEFFGLIFRLADLGLILVLCSFLLSILKKTKVKNFDLKPSLAFAILGLSLILYWIFNNLGKLYIFKTGFLTILALMLSVSLCYKYKPKWLLILLPYFCFDHILVSSTVAAAIFALLGVFAQDFDRLKVTKKWESLTILVILSVNLALAIYQVVVARSLGLGWLGEPNLSLSSTAGIAKQIIPFSGQIVLRGYGLMPHPNILGFLGVFGFLSSTAGFKLNRLSKNKLNLELLNILLSLAVIAISISRMAFMALTIWGIISLFLKYRDADKTLNFKKYISDFTLHHKIFVVILPILLFVLLVFSLATRSNSDLYRLKQHATLIAFMQKKPLTLVFGVGPGQYPSQLRAAQITENSWENEPFYQPFGNILIEFGLVGLGLIIVITSKILEIL